MKYCMKLTAGQLYTKLVEEYGLIGETGSIKFTGKEERYLQYPSGHLVFRQD